MLNILKTILLSIVTVFVAACSAIIIIWLIKEVLV